VPAEHAPEGIAVSPGQSGPATKEDCKRGSWSRFGFKNQGQCVAAVNHGPQP
jgi:hypothetical protein